MKTESQLNPLRDELKEKVTEIVSDDYQYGFHDNDIKYSSKPARAWMRKMVREISALKKEPAWMLERRVQAYKTFVKYPMPDFLSTNALNEIDFEKIIYFMRASDRAEKSWGRRLRLKSKRTFDRLGVPGGRAQLPGRRVRPV